MTPQSIHRMGGHRVQGRKSGRAAGCRERLLEDASALEAAGAFAIVGRGVPPSLAREITASVTSRLLGSAQPRLRRPGARDARHARPVRIMRATLAKPFAHLWNDAAAATEAYVREVKERAFPAPEHCYAESRRPRDDRH